MKYPPTKSWASETGRSYFTAVISLHGNWISELSYTLRRTFHFDLAFFSPGWGGGGCPMHGKYGGLYRVTVGISEYEQEGLMIMLFHPRIGWPFERVEAMAFLFACRIGDL